MLLSYEVDLKINWYAWWKLEIDNWVRSDRRIKTLITLETIFHRWLNHDECLVDWTKSDAQQYEVRSWFKCLIFKEECCWLKRDFDFDSQAINEDSLSLILLIEWTDVYWISFRFSSNSMIIYFCWFYWFLDVVLSFEVIDHQIHKFLYTHFIVSWVNLNE